MFHIFNLCNLKYFAQAFAVIASFPVVARHRNHLVQKSRKRGRIENIIKNKHVNIVKKFKGL